MTDGSGSRNRTTIDEDARSVEAAARDWWATEYVTGRKWTLWMRLSWRQSVSEAVATEQVQEWATRLAARIQGEVFVGIHSDTGRRHAHALVFVPRGTAPSNPPPCRWLPGIAREWHQHMWPHGLIWLERYSAKKAARPDGRHGAAYYAGRDPGAVMRFGTTPTL